MLCIDWEKLRKNSCRSNSFLNNKSLEFPSYFIFLSKELSGTNPDEILQFGIHLSTYIIYSRDR